MRPAYTHRPAADSISTNIIPQLTSLDSQPTASPFLHSQYIMHVKKTKTKLFLQHQCHVKCMPILVILLVFDYRKNKPTLKHRHYSSMCVKGTQMVNLFMLHWT